MPACTLRPAGAADAGFLFNLYAQTRAGELAASGWTAPQLDAFLRLQIAARDAHYRAHFPRADNQVVQWHGQDAGRLLVARGDEAIDLVDIALVPAHRGRGIGTALLRGLQSEAGRSLRPLRLHVERHNPARGLYRRLGFVETGTQGLHVAMQWRAAAHEDDAVAARRPPPDRMPRARRVTLSSSPTGDLP